MRINNNKGGESLPLTTEYNMTKITKHRLNRELKIIDYDLKFWYDRSVGQWVIEGIDKNNQWFSKGTCVFALHHLSFEQWIDMAIEFYNGEST